MQPQFSQGTAPSHHTQPYATPPEISQPNSGSVTSSLRSWRKKDYVDKPSSTENVPTSTGETISHIARVAPHTYYPRPSNDVCHYQHQFTEYSSVPYKQQAPTPVKYSEIVENQSNPAIEHISPIIKKQKEKEYVDLCGVSPQAHMKQFQEHIPLKQPYPDPVKQQYGDPNIHHQYISKDPQLHTFLQKQPQLHSQYVQKDQFQQYMPKYNMQAQYAQSYPSESNNFLAHLSKINPRMAQSIINDTHLRESQLPMYHNIDQNRSCQQPQRIFHGPPLHSNSSHQHRSIPQPYNYSQPYNYNVKPNMQQNDPYSRIQQYQHPKYITDYKINMDQPNMPSQRVYSESIHMNYAPMPPKVSPNYSHCAQQLEYAQHYQHRRSQIPQEFYNHPGFKAAYIQNHQVSPEENDPESRNRKTSLKQFLENWVEEDISGNLPDIIVSNNLTDMENMEEMKGTLCIKNSGSQDQPLYVLDTTEIPSETLPHFLHLQQFEKLPDNIRGYYHSTNSLPAGSRRIIIENNSSGNIVNGNASNTVISSQVQESGVPENCSVIRGGPESRRVLNQPAGKIERVFENKNVENTVVQIHIIESSEQPAPGPSEKRSEEFETVIIQANSLHQDLTNVVENETCVRKKLVPDDKGSGTESDDPAKHPKNMPVIDEVLQDESKEELNDKKKTVKANSDGETVLRTNVSALAKEKEIDPDSKTKDIEEDLIKIATNSQIEIFAEDLTEKNTKDVPQVAKLVDTNISDSDVQATDLSINNSSFGGDKEINLESKDNVNELLETKSEKCDLVHTNEPNINERNDELNLVHPTNSTKPELNDKVLEEDASNLDEKVTEVKDNASIGLNGESSKTEVCEPAEPNFENKESNENKNPIMVEDDCGAINLEMDKSSKNRSSEVGSVSSPSLDKTKERNEFETSHETVIQLNSAQTCREMANENTCASNTPIFENESDDFVDNLYDSSLVQTPKPLNLSMDRRYESYEPLMVNNEVSKREEKIVEETKIAEEIKPEPILKFKIKKLFLYEKHKKEKKRDSDRKKLFKKKRDKSLKRKLTLIESDVKAKLPKTLPIEDCSKIEEELYFEKVPESEVLPIRQDFEVDDCVEAPSEIEKLDDQEMKEESKSLNPTPVEVTDQEMKEESTSLNPTPVEVADQEMKEESTSLNPTPVEITDQEMKEESISLNPTPVEVAEQEIKEESKYLNSTPVEVADQEMKEESEYINSTPVEVTEEFPAENLEDKVLHNTENNNVVDEVEVETLPIDSSLTVTDPQVISRDSTPSTNLRDNLDKNPTVLQLNSETDLEKHLDIDEKPTSVVIEKSENIPVVDETTTSVKLINDESGLETELCDENSASTESKKIEEDSENGLSIDEKLESMQLRVDNEEIVCDDTTEIENFENFKGCESKNNEIEETLVEPENEICIEDKELIGREKITDPICSALTESVISEMKVQTVQQILEGTDEDLVEEKLESVEEAKVENSENVVGGNEPGIVYQINDTNVVLQIADELLEINITEQNGKKVILVKTFSNADVIMNNFDENDNQTCESIVCVEENPKPKEDELEAIINNDDASKSRPSEICEESELSSVIDDFCIFNEEIVSSSTEVEVVPKEKPVETLKKNSTKKDVAKKSSRKDKTLPEKHGSRKLSCLSNPSKYLPKSDSKKLKLVCENLSNAPRTVKTKAALKFLDSNENSGKSSSEHKVPSKTVKSVSFVENSESVDKKVKKSSVKVHIAKETIGILKTDSKSAKKTSEPGVHTKKETNKTVANKIVRPKEKRGSVEKKKSSTNSEKSNKSSEKSFKACENAKEVKVKVKTAENDAKKMLKQPRVPKLKLKSDVINKEKKNIKVQVKNTEIMETVLKSEEIVKNVTVKIKREISEKVKKIEKIEIQPKVEVEVEPQISVQENSITSSTCQEHDSVSKEVSTKTLLQNIADDWEDDLEDFKMTDSACKRRLSLEEYNKRKLGSVEYETSKIIESPNILPPKVVREKSPESPLLNVNFSNKTYSRSVSNLPSAKVSESSDESNSKLSEPLSSAIELQLPKVNRSRAKQIFSQEYLRKALLNDLHTVNAYTVSLIKENQQLMQRFLEEQRLTIDELKKVKKIIRYKRLVQHLSTIKIAEMNTSSSRENNYKTSNFLLNTQPLPDLPKFEKISQVQPINLSEFNLNDRYTCKRTDNVMTEKRKRKRFRFLHSDDETTTTNVSNSNTKTSVNDKIVENEISCKKTKLETSVPAVDYSVHPSNSQSQLTLVFKRNFRSDPKMQPYVKIERLASLDLLAKNNRF